MGEDNQRSVRLLFSCHHADIIYLNSVMDSYENLGLMRTLSRTSYNCALFSTAGLYRTAIQLLEALKKEGVRISDISVDESESVDEFTA